ncbi:MAG: TonB-dependent receptor [Saprospiraceae bacterium]
MKFKIYTFLLLMIGLSFQLSAQVQVTGQVKDAITGESMIGVTVRTNEGKGTITDYDGNYTVTITASTSITFSYIGYKSLSIEVITAENQGNTTSIERSVNMEEATSILDAVTVTTSRYEKNILKEAVTIDIIDPNFLANNQITQLDQIISKVPGIQIIDDQASVRGSGFSFGAGSRVSIIVDGLPLLAPEASTIPWNYVPIENIAQIEVLKGAASVLYGTSAMNGIINVQTAYPTAEPSTTWQTYAGVYSDPKKEYQIWWEDKPQPHNYGTYVSHRQKIGKKFDMVLGAHSHKELSFLQDANERRNRFNFNTRYRITDNLSVGINGNVMEYTKGFWGFWGDGDTLALQPLARLSQDSYFSRNFDPYLTYFDPYGNQHSIKTRFYSVTFLRTGNSQNTTAGVNHYEYQFNRQFKNKMNVTAGLNRQVLDVASPFFPYDTTAMEPGSVRGAINSIYAQLEKSMIDDRLTVALGSRWETYAFEDESQVGFPILRLAGSFAITPKDIIRANLGQGYRLPSLLEQYIDFNNGLQSFPNPELRPEIGASYEIGYKRAFDSKSINGYFDAVVFYNDYTDLIEPVFGFYNDDTTVVTISDGTNYGFKNLNITEARILGLELGGQISGKLREVGYRLWTGYTYTFPVNLATDTTNLSSSGFFIKSAVQSMFSVDTSLYEGILNYRSLHNYRLDLELYYKKLTVGIAANYQSRMINVDDIFVGEGYWGDILTFFNGGDDVFPGLADYRAEHTTGDLVWDFRLNYNVTEKVRLNFVINNVFNYEYALRIGKISPPRLMTLKMEVGI